MSVLIRETGYLTVGAFDSGAPAAWKLWDGPNALNGAIIDIHRHTGDGQDGGTALMRRIANTAAQQLNTFVIDPLGAIRQTSVLPYALYARNLAKIYATLTEIQRNLDKVADRLAEFGHDGQQIEELPADQRQLVLIETPAALPDEAKRMLARILRLGRLTGVSVVARVDSPHLVSFGGEPLRAFLAQPPANLATICRPDGGPPRAYLRDHDDESFAIATS